MTIAAMHMLEKKVWAHRSYRIDIRGGPDSPGTDAARVHLEAMDVGGRSGD